MALLSQHSGISMMKKGGSFAAALDTEEMAQEILEYLEIADKLNPNQHQRIDPN